MEIKEYKKQAFKDWKELSNIVYDYKGTLNELCDELNGFNYDEYDERFDLYFKSITTTIYKNNESFYVLNYIDIWDDNLCMIIAESIDIVDLEE